MSNVEALNVVLAGEYAAIYAYGIVAAHVTGEQQTRALTGMADHRQQRDRLRARIIEQGGTPVAGEAVYQLPAPVTSPKQARDLACLVEDRLSGQWAAVAAASEDREATTAALTAVQCSVRATSWTGSAPVWPGSL
jgi:hypothetical protein